MAIFACKRTQRRGKRITNGSLLIEQSWGWAAMISYKHILQVDRKSPEVASNRTTTMANRFSSLICMCHATLIKIHATKFNFHCNKRPTHTHAHMHTHRVSDNQCWSTKLFAVDTTHHRCGRFGFAFVAILQIVATIIFTPILAPVNSNKLCAY